MKTRFTQPLNFLLVFAAIICGQVAMGQTGVLNPNDTVKIYNPASPPAYPPANTLVKWVKTTRFGWSSDEYKCYFYNNVQFRLKFPKSYSTAQDGKTYPLYIFFAGVGESGSIYDNEFQFAHGGQIHLNAVDNGTFDGFLLYPQSSAPSGGWSQAQIDAMANLITNYLVPQVKVDINRIIASGLSGGGDAAWTFAETHPTIPAALFIMSSANISDIPFAPTLKFTPIWLFQGGLDRSPDPSTTIQLVNAYNNAGGNLTYKVFPNDGHNTWDDAWNQPGYFQWMLGIHKANAWPLTGRAQFCPTDNINANLGVTAGFNGYQWRKNGSPIPGATSNTFNATSIGTYDVDLVRGTTASVFSPTPVVVSIKAPTVSPNIQVSGLASDVLPAPDGSASVTLQVPAGYASYVWERADSPVNHPTILPSTTNLLTGATPGQYAVEVTEKFGCSSSFSTPFTVINANGPNAPSAPTNLLATALSQTQIKLTWNENPSPPNLETQFEIYQGAAATGPFKLIGFSPALVDSFIVNNLNPKTSYFYLVRAIDNTAASATAGPSSALTQSDITPPSAPANLRAATTGQTSVQLVWDPATDNVGVTAYDIYVNGNKAYSVGNVNTFTVYDLVNGTNYDFTVRARDFAGNVSPFSNQLAAAAAFTGLNYKYYSGSWNNLPDFNSISPIASGVVPNVSLSNALSSVNYGFTWTGFINIPVTGTYTFQTSSDDGSKLYIDIPYSVNATATVNNDGLHGTNTVTSAAMTLTAGVHTFVATYFQLGGGVAMTVNWKTPQTGGQFVAIPNSAFAQTVTSPGTPPTAPSGLAAVAASAKKINLSWQDNSNNETGFQLFRSSVATGPFVAIATVKANRTSYGDSSLSPTTTYYYKIQAIDQAGSSKFNAQDSTGLTYNFYSNYTANNLSAIATSTPTIKGTSTNFTLGVTSATSNFALTFNGYINITTAGSYTFYTSSDDGSNLLLDGTLLVNNDGLHGTQEVSGTSTLSVGRHAIQVNFFQQGGGQALTVSYAGPGISKTVIPDAALTVSPTSATTLALPALPAAPGGLTGLSQGPTHMALSWTNNATNATGFEVWRSPTTNTNYLLAATLPVVTAYVDSNLTNNTLYYYKVRAINEGGTSNYSNEITVTTSSAPVTTVTLTPVPNQSLVNDSTFTFPVSASSSSVGAAITFTASGLPFFGSLTDNHNGMASLVFKPNSTQLGVTNGVILTATDAFGGASSDTFSVTVSGRNATTVLLSFNTASNPVSAPWNGMNSSGNAGAVSSNFTDINGNPTTDGVTLVSAFDGAYNTGMNTGNNSGIFPDNELRNFYFGSTFNPYTFKVTGLNSSKKYALVFFAGYPWTASDVTTYGNLITKYTVGSQTVALNVANNINQTVQLSGLSPDASGNITVTVTKPVGSAYALINDMEILSYDAPASVASLIPPSNLVANGLSSTSIQLNWAGSPDTRTGFEIWRSTAPNGTFSLLNTVAGNVTTYTDASLPTNSTYFYEVREVVNSNQFSAFSNIAGGSTVQYTVNLSLNSQATTFSERAPWNDVNTLIAVGFQLPNMMDMNSQPTGVNFNVVRNFTSFNGQLGLSTGNNSGVVPDTVMKTFYYNANGDTAIVSFSGLSLTGVYNFGFYAGTSFASTQTVGIYKIGNQIVSLNAFNNTTNMVFINGVKPDSTGTVYITFYCDPATAYAMLNSITIQAMPSADVIGADSLGTSGVIATALANRGSMGTGAAILNTAAAVAAPNSSIGQRLNNSLGAYPNPFVDNLTVSLDFKQDVGKFTLVVIDAAGKVVQRNEFTNVPAGRWQQTLNLANLPRGSYFMQVMGIFGQAVQSFKLVKVK